MTSGSCAESIEHAVPLQSSRLASDFLASSLQRLWILSDVRMLWTRVNLQLLHHVTSKLVLWHHASDRMEDQVFGLASQTIAVAFKTQTGITGVPGEVTNVHLLAGHRDFIRVDDDDEIAAINVGGVLRAMLAHQNHRNIAGQSTKNFVLSVDDQPLFFDFASFGDVRSLSNHLAGDQSKRLMCRERVGKFSDQNRPWQGVLTLCG